MAQIWLGGGATKLAEPVYCLTNFWDSREAVFKPCFLPVIAAIPAAFAALLLVFRILGLLVRWRPSWTRPFVEEHAPGPIQDEIVPRKRRSSLSILLILIASAGLFVSLAEGINAWPSLQGLYPLLPWLVAVGLLAIHSRPTPSYSALSILALLGIAKAIVLASLEQRLSDHVRGLGIASVIIAILSISIILCMPLRDPQKSLHGISQPSTEPTASLRSPEDNLTLFRWLTVVWMNPLIAIGYKRQLQDEDVWQLPFEFQHRRLHDNFAALKGTVIQRLIRANAVDLFIMTILCLIELVTTFANPILLQQLLSVMQNPDASKRAAIVYAALTLATALVATQTGVINLWYGRRCYERSRGEMITMLYAKTLGRKIAFEEEAKKEQDLEANGQSNGHASGETDPSKDTKPLWRRIYMRVTGFFSSSSREKESKQPATMGKILNLMRNDVYNVAQRFWEVQQLLRVPLATIISIVLLIRFMGKSALLAVAMLVTCQIISAGIVRVMVYYGKKRRAATDVKLQFVTQFVEAIRHLRWYGWQGHWLEQILEARQKELWLRVVLNLWMQLVMFIQSLSVDLVPPLVFFAFTVLEGKRLTVDIAFPAMQLFSMVNQALRGLPGLITVLTDAWVAVGRIEDFMAEPDREEMATEALIGDSMAIEHGSFAWPGLSDPVLKDITVSFAQGMTVICGEVGSGKTALLQALLGELDMFEGQLIRPQEPIGYCAQTPWLQSMSIRENILFSAPYDEKRYREVLDVCALTPDLAEFKAGDLSMIGENGIGLSGGQKARVALARAVYSRANILLLDDPLSALDQQTAESIARKCLAGPLMEGRTIVLVTHRTDLVSDYTSQMIRIDDGRAQMLENDAFADHGLKRMVSSKSQGDEDKPTEEQTATAVPDKFEEDEFRRHGGVQLQVYWEYVKAGKLHWWAVLTLFLTLYRVDSVLEAYVLRVWGEAYQTTAYLLFAIQKASIHISTDFGWPFDTWPAPEVDVTPWLTAFTLAALGETIFYSLAQGMMLVVIYVAARRMFKGIMYKVANATFRFYDVTPVGRLMNRMTSDIEVLDGNIASQFQAVAYMGISWLSSLVVIATVTPTFLVFSVLLVVVFVYFFMKFLPTSQSLRRLEMVSLTPLMSNFGALLNGLGTVRAFRAQEQFQARVIEVVDNFQKMDHFYWSLQAWLMFRYDVLSDMSTFLITMLALATNLSPGLTAFALLYAQKFVGNTHGLCKQYGQLQMEFVSVERVIELLHIDQEPPGTVAPPAWWPSFQGEIVFEKVQIRYAPHLDPALDGVSFTVKGGSKTAVIGRTGSGKSTLALAMLATILPTEGRIVIDNVDLAEVDKHLLRTRITFLAQDPVLFPGSMRQNLDPVEEHTDEACAAVLQRVCERQGWSLETPIEAGGRNLSQGQRQLVGLARAVLRRSAIIILDEATASIDRETAMQIQQVMHEEMKDSTVITIAHRLEAVRKADYCIVLGKGKILRQGPADEMLREAKDEMVDEVEEEEDDSKTPESSRSGEEGGGRAA